MGRSVGTNTLEEEEVAASVAAITVEVLLRLTEEVLEIEYG